VQHRPGRLAAAKKPFETHGVLEPKRDEIVGTAISAEPAVGTGFVMPKSGPSRMRQAKLPT
jgi:hypothetical protein